MSDQSVKNPVIRPGWLRVLLFGCCFCLVTLLVAIPAVLSLTDTSAQQLKDHLLPTLSGMLTSDHLWLMIVLECVISVISVCIFRFLVDRKGWADLGWTIEDFQGESLTGLFMGPALLGIVSVLMLLSGHLQWTDIVWEPSSLFVSFGLMALIAFSEETVFRGYILGNLLESFSNKWIALTISALLFASFHLTSPGLHTLAFANLFLAGLLLGSNYIYTKNLWFSFFFHLSWNFFQGPVLGFRVSGLSFPPLLLSEPKGDLFITGGDFGLEGSILNTAISLISVLILTWAFGRKYGGSSALTA